MATAVVMPKQGQSVESCIIVEWKRNPGDTIGEGDILCEVETDKAVLEVPSPVSGTLLVQFFSAGDDVAVLTNIAAVGTVGEDVSELRPDNASTAATSPPASTPAPSQPSAPRPAASTPAAQAPASTERVGISPRARNLAERKQIEVAGIQGSGPGGRIIERDIQAALANQPLVSPVAKAMMASGDFAMPDQGSGPGGRIMARDLASPTESPPTASPAASPLLSEPGESESIPVRGVRKVIAERMLNSLQTTAQLTMHCSADARALLALRKRLKASDAALGLQGVTINDLILFAVARIVPQHPLLNATFSDETITQYHDLHLGFAVDTPRGLLVPVIRQANRLSLRALAQEGKRLTMAIQAGEIQPDEMAGGTFTVTNLGNLGIEQFTPILNVPQVAILGVGNVTLKAIAVDAGINDRVVDGMDDEVAFIPHIALSLTINHQVVDGAPAARFLQALALGIRDLDLLLAI